MPRPRRWTNEELISAVSMSASYRHVLILLKLRPTGGNYKQLMRYIAELGIDTSHFTGKVWNKGQIGLISYRIPLEEILIVNSYYQSHMLKKRLIRAGLKHPACELCGWSVTSADGRIPVELDHINGINTDNRLENLRILCPNCHSLQPTHRGKNKKARRGAFVSGNIFDK